MSHTKGSKSKGQKATAKWNTCRDTLRQAVSNQHVAWCCPIPRPRAAASGRSTAWSLIWPGYPPSSPRQTSPWWPASQPATYVQRLLNGKFAAASRTFLIIERPNNSRAREFLRHRLLCRVLFRFANIIYSQLYYCEFIGGIYEAIGR